jgi:hypothetical protein
VCGYALTMRLWVFIELLALAGGKPRWDVVVDTNGLPTMTPSDWFKTGCWSHFSVRNGRITGANGH